MADLPATPLERYRQFIREAKEIDLAHHEGRLDEWLREKLREKLANERSAAETND